MPTARTTDGIDVAYFDLGGDGPPLLLAHATGFHGLVWKPVAEALAADFHCYAFDERGHGDTPAPAEPLDWHGFALDALAVVDDLGLARPFGVGHSAGGAALLLGEVARPGTFRALYCYEPIVFPTDGPLPPSNANPLAEGARRRREVFPSKDAALENYASKPPMQGFTPAALRAYVDHGFAGLPDGTVRLKCRGEVEARTYEMGSQHGAWDRLGEVQCPTTIAYGERTTTFGPDVFRRQAARIPHARVDEIAGASHFGPMEDPDAVAASIRRALLAAG